MKKIEKTRIYNLIVLDKSGSMDSIRKAAYEGCNEVLGGIRAAAKEHADDQEQFVSLLLFDSYSMPYIHKCTPAADARNLKEEDYEPCACTPLLDAVGMALKELKHEVEKHQNAVGMVTIITDGEENSSSEYTYPQIQKLIGELKEKGWNFAFMGANQDVTKVCVELNINVGNACAFEADDSGMREAMDRDRKARNRYYARMADIRQEAMAAPCGCAPVDMQASYRKMNDTTAYFEEDEKK